VNVKPLFTLVAHKPIGVNPFVSLITGDANFLITATAGYYHLIGDYFAIVNRVNYLVNLISHNWI
jgi:hypothetical protein